MNRESETYYADQCIENAIKSNDDGVSLYYALSGMGLYRLGTDKYHNFIEAIDALYRYINLNPDKDISSDIKKAFYLLVTDLGLLNSLYVTLGTLKYQNKNQVDGISPFMIDIKYHMDMLLESIKKDEDLRNNQEAYVMYEEFVKLIQEDNQKVISQ